MTFPGLFSVLLEQKGATLYKYVFVVTSKDLWLLCPLYFLGPLFS